MIAWLSTTVDKVSAPLSKVADAPNRECLYMHLAAFMCLGFATINAISGAMIVASGSPQVTEEGISVTLKVYVGSLIAVAAATWAVFTFINSMKQASSRRFAELERKLTNLALEVRKKSDK